MEVKESLNTRSHGEQAILQGKAKGCMGEDNVRMDKIHPKCKDIELLTPERFPSNLIRKDR